MLNMVRIVLVEPSHPGNIGATARAMKNMGLSQLFLVNPKTFPHADATSRASGADDVLAQVVVCESLDEALSGCHLVIGASARLRRLSIPQWNPRQCAEETLDRIPGQVPAIVFGREHSGLTNEELGRCHQLVHIPSNPDYSSLNLAAAVQVICYELRMAMEAVKEITPGEVSPQSPVPAEEMERFYEHLRETLVDIGFLDPENPRIMMRRLRRLFNRSGPDDVEMNILRGILTAAQKARK
ncbi:RNA methyltransferase [Kaarinaea lacus]